MPIRYGALRKYQAWLNNNLPIDEYDHDQIIGPQIATTEDELLSAVTDILSVTSNDNYIVRGSAEEVLIPAIKDVNQSIDINKVLSLSKQSVGE